MAGRGGWRGYAEQAANDPAAMYGPPTSSQDVPQRGRQLHREPVAPHPACGSWQAGGGPDAFSGGHTRSLSAPPADLAERWAAGHAPAPHPQLQGPQPRDWQPGGRPGASTHLANQVLPLLAEAPAQPSPSALLPAEQQQWLKQRLRQAQHQLAQQRAEQAAWAAAAAQLLRGRAPQPAAASEEARCPTCMGGSGQDSTGATDSQQLEVLIESLEAEMEERLGELQRRQRWEQAQQQAQQQVQCGHQNHAQSAGAAWDRQQQGHQPMAQSAGTAWDRQRQERERLALLRSDQDQWQRAAAAAMQQQPPSGLLPSGQQRQQLGQPPTAATAFNFEHGYGSSDMCMAPVRLSAPARLQDHRQAPVGMTTADPSLLLNRAWEQQQRQRQSWQQAQPELPSQQQQRQQSWQQQAHLHRHQQMAAQQSDSAGQPWTELARTGAQLQLEQQQWAVQAREMVARSSGGQPPSWH